nr:MAK10-like protein [Tanacetum cinerariifolium]
MGDDNPIRTLGDYFKPSHEGYRNTIELPVQNKVFKDLLQKVPHHGIGRWLQIYIFYDHVSFHLKCEIDRAASGKLRNKNTDESWEIIENLALYDHEGWNDTKEFVKPVKAIFTPQPTLKTPDRRLLKPED